MTSKIVKTQKQLLDRRQFLNRMGALGAGAVGVSALTWAAYSDDPVRRAPEIIHTLKDFRVDLGPNNPTMVIARGVDPDIMVKAAVERLGGIEKLIGPGDKVVIKPNVAWDRLPEQAANTNPLVVAAVVKLVISARPSSVTVTDVSLNDPYRSFSRSGIEEAAIRAGAKIWIPSENDFKLADLRGSLLKQWLVSRAFLEADKVINVPVIKHHSLSKCTLAQKNWYGILGGRRNQLHQDIHTSIADLAQAMRPTLTVMDGTRVLMRNGPTGGSLNDVEVHNTIIAGFDEVAIDAYSMSILGIHPDQVKFMAMSQKRGLGVIDWKSTRYDELTV